MSSDRTTSPAPPWARAIDSRVARGLAPGMVALAAWPDRVEVHAAGFRDLAQEQPMQRDTLFRVASVSKIVTAMAAMTLVDEGRIDLNEPVGRWLPELDRKPVVADLYGPIANTRASACEITLRHLLSMTSGMGMYFGQRAHSPLIEAMQRRSIAGWTEDLTADALMSRLADLPLMFDPGARWVYHLGIELAGVLIERMSGERLGAYMQRRLFDPLGLRDTGFSVPPEQVHRLSRIYTNAGGGRYGEVQDWDADRTVPPAMDRGGGGLISSADDLGKLGRLLLDDGIAAGRRILSTAALREMTRDHVSAEAKAHSPVFQGFWEQYGFGLGLCIATAPNAISRTPGRFGWWGGTGTALFADPARNVVLVSLTQRMIERLDDSGNADAFMHAVLDGGGRA